MTDQSERDALTEYVIRELRSEARWTRGWSTLHHCSLYGASILSASAALTLQLKTLGLPDGSRADVAAVFAAVASIIGVISVSGGFARKWRANRMTKASLEQIEIDLMDPSCDLAGIRAALKDMNRIHHLAIIGDEAPTKFYRKTTLDPGGAGIEPVLKAEVGGGEA